MMRPTPNIFIEMHRLEHPILGDSPPGSDWGFFMIGPLRIISSGMDQQYGWEHVSVSCLDRCPTWDEMQKVKELFWGDDETVVQYHPKKSEYVNHHSFCLHLWKKTGHEFEAPPTILVGPK